MHVIYAIHTLIPILFILFRCPLQNSTRLLEITADEVAPVAILFAAAGIKLMIHDFLIDGG